jgi:hypothetical protein
MSLMTKAVRDLLKRALELAPKERVKLAQELLGSVEEDGDDSDPEVLDPAFVARLRRDAEAFLSGKAPPGIPADEAFEALEKRLAAKRRARGQAG